MAIRYGFSTGRGLYVGVAWHPAPDARDGCEHCGRRGCALPARWDVGTPVAFCGYECLAAYVDARGGEACHV